MSLFQKIFNFLNKTHYKIIKDGVDCPICNHTLETETAKVIPEELINDWKLNEYEVDQFNIREGNACINCGASQRLRNIAQTLLLAYSEKELTLSELLKTKLSNHSIAEINYCDQLHNLLLNCKGLHYSEFGSEEQSIRHEDLMSLSYRDNSFDLVLNTDVLEHVPNIDTALAEISRVLKKGGVFIFTVPIIFGRKTKQRAVMNEFNEIEFLDSKSYHGDYTVMQPDYLVFYEFGGDFTDKLQNLFDVTIVKRSDDHKNLRTVFLCKNNKG